MPPSLLQRKLQVAIEPSALDRAHRLGPPRTGTSVRPRPVIVKFKAYFDKKAVFGAKSKLKGQKFLITESLTKTRHILLKKAKEHFSNNRTWTSDGKVVVKVEGEQNLKTLASHRELLALISAHPTPHPDAGIVHLEWVPEGQTITQYYYLEVLTRLREKIRKKRPELWNEKSWFLHRDNAPAHSAFSVKTFLAKYNIPVLEHPPYSPDLAPCDFYLFPKIKSALKGTRFESVDAVKKKAAEVMKGLTQNDLQHCFDQWKIRLERCRDRGGEYIEGDNY
ncbi:hypothetical protein WDU94_010745 [Cyamophila willieti]